MQRIHTQMFRIGIIISLSLSILTNPTYSKNQKPTKPVYAALAVDAETGQILYQQNADMITPPASLTKIMTLLMVFDALEQGKLRLTDMLPISRHAAAQLPCKLGLRAGSYISVKDIILACVTKSANDAAVVIAEFLAGSEPAFADYMTQRARHFGMKNTTFKTASGMPAIGQLTTAKDMALLGIVANKHYKKYFHLFSTREFCYNNACHINHNYRLLAQKHLKFDGIKTGFVNASGFNVIGTYTNEVGKRVVVVVMGGPTPAWRDKRVVEIAQRLKTVRPQNYVAEKAPTNPEPKPMLVAQTSPSADTSSVALNQNPDDDSAPIQEIAPVSAESGNYSLLLGYYGSQLRAETVAKQALMQSKLGVNKPISTKRIRVGSRYLYQASIDKLSKKQVDQASAVLKYFNIDSSTIEQPS
jgi:D-alanyl-D-alanine carboxypeptidase